MPRACTFCAKLHGNEVRYKSAAQLLEEIEAADARVSDGTLQVTRWPLFRHVADAKLKHKQVAWAAVYDEDFLLFRNRAVEFFRLWDASPLSERYRLSFQANPCSMLASDGMVDEDLLDWIDRLKPMVQLGAESFNGELLARWHKRHDLRQLHAALDALDRTQQDYTVFQLLTDFDTTPEELVDTLWLLIVNALRRRRMRIASSPFTIPLYDSDTRRLLEYGGRLGPDRIRDFSDYERPQPGWMDPLAAELAELADAELQFALEPEHRDAALVQAFESVVATAALRAARGENPFAVRPGRLGVGPYPRRPIPAGVSRAILTTARSRPQAARTTASARPCSRDTLARRGRCICRARRPRGRASRSILLLRGQRTPVEDHLAGAGFVVVDRAGLLQLFKLVGARPPSRRAGRGWRSSSAGPGRSSWPARPSSATVSPALTRGLGQGCVVKPHGAFRVALGLAACG